jgi:hypothetical protein
MNYRRPGRPVGPTPNRKRLPYDPEGLTHEHKFALCVVAANPTRLRYDLMPYVGFCYSVLSQIACSELGQAYLDELARLPPERLAPYRIERLDIHPKKRRRQRPRLDPQPVP